MYELDEISQETSQGFILAFSQQEVTGEIPVPYDVCLMAKERAGSVSRISSFLTGSYSRFGFAYFALSKTEPRLPSEAQALYH